MVKLFHESGRDEPVVWKLASLGNEQRCLDKSLKPSTESRGLSCPARTSLELEQKATKGTEGENRAQDRLNKDRRLSLPGRRGTSNSEREFWTMLVHAIRPRPRHGTAQRPGRKATQLCSLASTETFTPGTTAR